MAEIKFDFSKHTNNMVYKLSGSIGHHYGIIKGQYKHKNCNSPVFRDNFIKLMTEIKFSDFTNYSEKSNQIKETLCDKHKNNAVCINWDCDKCKYKCCNLCLISCSTNIKCWNVTCKQFMNKCKICAEYYCDDCYHSPLTHKFSCFEYVKCYICDQSIVEHEIRQKYEWISVLDYNIACGKLLNINENEWKYKEILRENNKITVYYPMKIRSISRSCEKHMIILHTTCELKNKHITIISETGCDAMDYVDDGSKYSHCEICWIQDKLCCVNNYPVKKCAELKKCSKDNEYESNVTITEV